MFQKVCSKTVFFNGTGNHNEFQEEKSIPETTVPLRGQHLDMTEGPTKSDFRAYPIKAGGKRTNLLVPSGLPKSQFETGTNRLWTVKITNIVVFAL